MRVWQVATQNGSGGFSSSSNMQIATQAKAMKSHEGPALDCCWSDDNTKIFSVGADKKGMLWDLASDQFNQVAAHDQPITCCGYVKAANYECVVTGSLDKTIKLWDMRQPNPAKVFNVPEVQNTHTCVGSSQVLSQNFGRFFVASELATDLNLGVFMGVDSESEEQKSKKILYLRQNRY